jgi:hypothetical protein
MTISLQTNPCESLVLFDPVRLFVFTSPTFSRCTLREVKMNGWNLDAPPQPICELCISFFPHVSIASSSIFRVFLVKSPCRLARILDEGHCPPWDKPHDMNHYPYYFAVLYYPEYHLSCFESPENFCAWLKTSLTQFCSVCSSMGFRGCVSYDGVCITVCRQQVSMSIALSEIADASYCHCTNFPLVKLSLSKCVCLRS